MDSDRWGDLLAQAALFDRFDEATLAALLPAAGAARAALLDSSLVIATPGRPGELTLRDDVRAEQRRHLRRAGPRAEIELRSHAYQVCLTRLAAEEGPGRAAIEAQAFEQLARLFTLLYLHFEWQSIRDLVVAAKDLTREQRHQHRLALYEAFVCVRTGDYGRGGQMLDDLLAADHIETQVHLEATQALAHLRRFRSQYDQALQTYEELARLADRYDNQVYRGVALYNIGAIYNEIEDYERALSYVLESKRIFAACDDQERLAYAAYSAGLNAMYLGHWQLARDQYTTAAALFEELGMEITLATCYWGQGFLAMLLGDAAASESTYRQAIASSTRAGRGDPQLALDARVELGFLYFTQGHHQEALACYDEGLALAVQLRHEHRIANAHYLRGRALQALGRAEEASAAYGAAMASVDALRGAHQQEEIKIGVLGTAQQVYEAAALHCLEQGRGGEAFAVVERACSRAFLDSLAARDPELSAAFEQPTAALAEVQAALPPDGLLLEYYTTGVFPSGEHFYHKIPPENKVLLEHLLLPARVVLFAITRHSCAVHRIELDPNSLRPTAGDPRPGRHLVRERVLVSLYERLVAPVEGLLTGCAQLFIVPHGPLHSVPFMALRGRAGRHIVAADGPAIAMAPSATILVRNCLGRPPTPPSGDVLAVGYNSEGAAALRYAEPEARMVARALAGTALTGPRAQAQALTDAAPQLRTLHIAGHARFQPDDPLGSYLALAGGESLSARAIMGGVRTRADLVVLSACTSGLSHVVPGDELLGLQRAWLHAGAAAVVCALWEAPDLVTLLIMERFYASLAGGATPGIALRDAIVAVRGLTGRDLASTFARWREQDPAFAAADALPEVRPELAGSTLYADPIHWAPFMLIGRP